MAIPPEMKRVCLADSAGWRESHCSLSCSLWFPFVLPGAKLLFSVLQADCPPGDLLTWLLWVQLMGAPTGVSG